MDDQLKGMTLAGYALSVATLNNLRGVGVFTDDQIEAIYGEVLSAMNRISDEAGSHVGSLEVAMRLIEREIDRERSTRPLKN